MNDQNNVDFETVPAENATLSESIEKLRAATTRLLQSYAAFLITSQPFRQARAVRQELEQDYSSFRRYRSELDFTLDADTYVVSQLEKLISRYRAETTMLSQYDAAAASWNELRTARNNQQIYLNEVAALCKENATRIVFKQHEAVQKQTCAETIYMRQHEFADHVTRVFADSAGREVASPDKFAPLFAVLEKALYTATRAHFKTARARKELQTIWQDIEDHYEEQIPMPAKPTAEEVYQLITRWTEWVKKLFILERAARLAAITFTNSVLPRKIALRELHTALQNVPPAKSLMRFEQIALVVFAEEMNESIVNENSLAEYAALDRIPQRQPEIETAKDAEKEKGLVLSLREVSEVFAYALAAARMSAHQLSVKSAPARAQPPVLADANAAEDWLQKGLDAYQIALDRHQADKDRALHLHAARCTQLQACGYQLESARSRGQKRAEEATDALLIPMEVARQLAHLAGSNLDYNKTRPLRNK